MSDTDWTWGDYAHPGEDDMKWLKWVGIIIGVGLAGFGAYVLYILFALTSGS